MTGYFAPLWDALNKLPEYLVYIVLILAGIYIVAYAISNEDDDE